MIQTQLYNIYKFDSFDSQKATSQQKQGGENKVMLVASTNHMSSNPS